MTEKIIFENVKDIIIDEKHKLINKVNYDYLIDARGFSALFIILSTSSGLGVSYIRQ